VLSGCGGGVADELTRSVAARVGADTCHRTRYSFDGRDVFDCVAASEGDTRYFCVIAGEVVVEDVTRDLAAVDRDRRIGSSDRPLCLP
jgi:hypothetical protein